MNSTSYSTSPDILIYTKNWCGYCRAAKQLLGQMNLTYKEVDVTHDQERYEEMLRLSEGRTSVPQIFINGEGIGGYTDLLKLAQQSAQQQ